VPLDMDSLSHPSVIRHIRKRPYTNAFTLAQYRPSAMVNNKLAMVILLDSSAAIGTHWIFIVVNYIAPIIHSIIDGNKNSEVRIPVMLYPLSLILAIPVV